MRHRPDDVLVYQPARGGSSFEEWLFSALGPRHRRALTAAILAILPTWGMDAPSVGFGRRRGPGLVELRLRFDAHALRLRAARIDEAQRPVTRHDRSPALGRRERSLCVLRAFFTERAGRIVVLSGGAASTAAARGNGSTPGLHEARWRLRELSALDQAGVPRCQRLAKDTLEHIFDEQPTRDATPDSGVGAGLDEGPLFLDFAVIHARVRHEAKREGRHALAELRAVQSRVRLAASLVAQRKRAGLTQRQLSALSGIRQGEISRLEHAGSNPTLQTLGALADALGAELCMLPRERPEAAEADYRPRAAASAAIDAGGVPQQPPTMPAPAAG